jgi:tetratricopeptide (TPR) repeat protein
MPDVPAKDFSFIQDPSAYHVLPAANIPPPFLNAPDQPSISAPLETLLSSGRYRLAAVAAARSIVQSAAPTDHTTLLYLLHVRLACLCLLSEHALAAHESKVLGDLNSAFYRHPLTNAHLVPWDLRVLIVRLAALGYGEWRKGVMGYYELASECRDNITKATAEEDKQTWRTRLRDCGIRVANILVEMGELEGAAQHLSSFSSSKQDSDAPRTKEERDVYYMETLVHLRLGDVHAARRCLAAATEISADELLDGTLDALIHLSNSEYPAAVSAFGELHDEFPEDAMVTQNLAVSLLYTGQIAEARRYLTDLAESSPPFHSLVFNLSTVYELCTERNRDKKSALAEKLASRSADGVVGWEVGNTDLKL